MLKILILPFMAITLLMHTMVAVANDFRPVECQCINQNNHNKVKGILYQYGLQRNSCGGERSCSLAGGKKYSACFNQVDHEKIKVFNKPNDTYDRPEFIDMSARMSCDEVKKVKKRTALNLSYLEIKSSYAGSCKIAGGVVVAFDKVTREFNILAKNLPSGACKVGKNYGFDVFEKNQNTPNILNLKFKAVQNLGKLALYNFILNQSDTFNTPINYNVSEIAEVEPKDKVTVGSNKAVRVSVSVDGFTIDAGSLSGINTYEKPFVFKAGSLVGFISGIDNSPLNCEKKILENKMYTVCTDKKNVYVAKKISKQIKQAINQRKNAIEYEYLRAAGVYIDRQNKGEVVVKHVCRNALYDFKEKDKIAAMLFPNKITYDKARGAAYSGNNIIQVVNTDQVMDSLDFFTKQTIVTYVYVIRSVNKKRELVELKPKRDKWTTNGAVIPRQCALPSRGGGSLKFKFKINY